MIIRYKNQIFTVFIYLFQLSSKEAHNSGKNHTGKNISIQNKQTNTSFYSGKLRTLVFSGTKLQSHNIKANASSTSNIKEGSQNLKVSKCWSKLKKSSKGSLAWVTVPCQNFTRFIPPELAWFPHTWPTDRPRSSLLKAAFVNHHSITQPRAFFGLQWPTKRNRSGLYN